MAKYHIDKNGKPAICRATTRACPYENSSPHFDTETEAFAYVNKQMEAQFGLMPSTGGLEREYSYGDGTQALTNWARDWGYEDFSVSVLADSVHIKISGPNDLEIDLEYENQALTMDELMNDAFENVNRYVDTDLKQIYNNAFDKIMDDSSVPARQKARLISELTADYKDLTRITG